MIQVFQAEWCPFSHQVREKLTELGVDYVIRQTEPYPEQRSALVEATGQDSIPAVVLEDGTVLAGDTDDIVRELDERLEAWEHQDGHVEQAAAHER
jgi:glutaredoxin